jgi:hypothetical protein
MDNELDHPDRIHPEVFDFQGEGKALQTQIPAYSFSVFVVEK